MISRYINRYDKQKDFWFIKILLITIISVLIFFNIEISIGQENIPENDYINKSKDNLHNLAVIFESIKINNDHDLLFSAEWKMDVYVNDKKIQLLPINNTSRVESGQIIPFDNKEIKLNLSGDDTLKIITIGVEFDNIGDYKNNYLPNLSGIITKDTRLSEYKNKIIDSIQYLISLDRNDAIGIIAKEFAIEDNFGIGHHDTCSEHNGEPGDLYDTVETNCDFRLKYNIQ